MADHKIDGFWTGPIWRAVETFACGMAGVPVPVPEKRYGKIPKVGDAYYQDTKEMEDGETQKEGA